MKDESEIAKENEVFKVEFLKLVERHPCSMGYYFQDQISEFEYNCRPKSQASHKTVSSIVESLEAFIKKYPESKILPADDPYNMLVGFIVYTELDGKEIAEAYTISLKNVEATLVPVHEMIKEKFRARFVWDSRN